jgi:hypothetical protein
MHTNLDRMLSYSALLLYPLTVLDSSATAVLVSDSFLLLSQQFVLTLSCRYCAV